MLALQRLVGNRAVARLVRPVQAGASGVTVSPHYHAGRSLDRDGSLRGAGQPLDPSTRSFMESCFGQDFGAVRLHTDPHSARAAERIGARAFTVGRDVFFAAGQYRPTTDRGKRLLAHELTHVVQQAGASGAAAPGLSHHRDPAELEAARVADAVGGDAAPARPRVRLPRSIQRQGVLHGFLADLEQRRRRVQSLARVGTASIALFGDQATGKISGYQLTQKFNLKLAPDARASDYAIVQWIKGELYQQQGTQKVYWPANAAGALYGRSSTDPWRFTDWIVDSPDADPRFGSHRGLTVTVPSTDYEDSPGIIITGGPLPVGLRYIVDARMGVYPWGYRIPTTIRDWESQRPTPFAEVSWGWDITVDPDQTSLTVNFK